MAQGKSGVIDQDMRLNVRISSDLYKAAKELAYKQNIKFSELFRRVLTAEIEKNISQK